VTTKEERDAELRGSARRHTGDGKLKNDGAKHATVVVGVPE
jgi:hypothetical protein